jgi:hypothetical protein
VAVTQKKKVRNVALRGSDRDFFNVVAAIIPAPRLATPWDAYRRSSYVDARVSLLTLVPSPVMHPPTYTPPLPPPPRPIPTPPPPPVPPSIPRPSLSLVLCSLSAFHPAPYPPPANRR